MKYVKILLSDMMDTVDTCGFYVRFSKCLGFNLHLNFCQELQSRKNNFVFCFHVFGVCACWYWIGIFFFVFLKWNEVIKQIKINQILKSGY